MTSKARHQLTLAVGICALALAPAAPASAGAEEGSATVVSASDPDDVGSRLDIVRERVRVEDGLARLHIRTAEGWACRYLNDIGSSPGDTASAALLWEIDKNSDGELSDRIGEFACRSGDVVFRVSDPSGQHQTRTFDARRPDRRTAVVRVPRKVLGGQEFAVRAISRVSGVTGDAVLFEEDDVTRVLKVR